MRTFSRPGPQNGDHIAAGPRASERAAVSLNEDVFGAAE